MPTNENDKTKTFMILDDKDAEMKHVLATVYEALSEKSYHPLDQIVGYLISEDPTYITNYKNARSLIRKVDRIELLNTLVKSYLGL